jgi:hypothetical protein
MDEYSFLSRRARTPGASSPQTAGRSHAVAGRLGREEFPLNVRRHTPDAARISRCGVRRAGPGWPAAAQPDEGPRGGPAGRAVPPDRRS